MLILEGKGTVKNPTEQDIERELRSLDAGEIEFVILRRGDEFIQAAQHEKPRYLRVEARASAGSMDGQAMYQMYEQAYPATFGSAVELFNNYLTKKSFRLDSSWKTFEPPPQIKKRTALSAAILMLLAGGLISAASFAARASNQPWQSGAFMGLAAVAVFAFMMFAAPRIYHHFIPKKAEELSRKMGMPCRVTPGYRRYHVEVIDGKTKTLGKKMRIEMAVIIAAIVGAVLLLGGISLIVYMAQATHAKLF